MKKLLLLISLTGLLSVGCSNAEPLVKAAEKYSVAVCDTCKDATCGLKAVEDYSAEIKKLVDKKMTPNADEAQKIADATQKASECMQKLPAAAPK